MLRIFFRRIEITGQDNLPRSKGALLIAWHPNGLIDPALILTTATGNVIFGARDGLFKWPILGTLMNILGVVPIYKGSDNRELTPEQRSARNADSLKVLAAEIANGGMACLFPEGASHDSPHPLEVRSGAARLFVQAANITPEKTPQIIPVGLHYDSKHKFRSDVLVAFHPAIKVHPSDSIESISETIQTALFNATHATDNWRDYHLMNRVRTLTRAERAHRVGANLNAPSMAEQTLGYGRVWLAYRELLANFPERALKLRERVAKYDNTMRALGIQDHNLHEPPPIVGLWFVGLMIFQAVLILFFMTPILLLGYIVNGPPAILVGYLSGIASKKKKDVSSVKLLLSVLVFPTIWGLVGYGVSNGSHTVEKLFPTLLFPVLPSGGIYAGATVVLLSIIGGLLALKYIRLVKETINGLSVRLTLARRKVTLATLRVERAELTQVFEDIADSMDLPGNVGPTGRVHQ